MLSGALDQVFQDTGGGTQSQTHFFIQKHHVVICD